MYKFLAWAVRLPLNLTAPVISWFLAPAIVLFAKDGWLPSWLWWFQTYDNSLDGDGSYQELHAPYKGNPSDLSSWQRYCNRVAWLWRNPAYGFDKYALGVAFNKNSVIKGVGNCEIKDGRTGISGWCYITIDEAFLFLVIMPVGFGKCFRIELGWKLKDFYDNPALLDGGIAQYVFSPRFANFES